MDESYQGLSQLNILRSKISYYNWFEFRESIENPMHIFEANLIIKRVVVINSHFERVRNVFYLNKTKFYANNITVSESSFFDSDAIIYASQSCELYIFNLNLLNLSTKNTKENTLWSLFKRSYIYLRFNSTMSLKRARIDTINLLLGFVNSYQNLQIFKGFQDNLIICRDLYINIINSRNDGGIINLNTFNKVIFDNITCVDFTSINGAAFDSYGMNILYIKNLIFSSPYGHENTAFCKAFTNSSLYFINVIVSDALTVVESVNNAGLFLMLYNSSLYIENMEVRDHIVQSRGGIE